MPKVAIIAALEREVALLVQLWRRVEREHDGRRYTFFEGDFAVLTCSGIGPEFARRATEAAIALYQSELVVSAGFAGALVPGMKIGKTLFPLVIIDAQDGSRWESIISDTRVGQTDLAKVVLVSFPGIADREQKERLAQSFGAQMVDMEAAAVARGAAARGIPFIAAKGISDELDLALPPLDRFVGADGKFDTLRFVVYVAPRFWLWPRVLRLARNSRRAAHSLSLWMANDILWTTMTERSFGEQGTVLG